MEVSCPIARDCVKRKGSVYDKYEYNKFMNKQAGDVFTPQEQCSLVYGPGSEYYGVCKSSVPLFVCTIMCIDVFLAS
ncbi:hypothetical protein CHS0354_010463 [Potamilus streckersoni]|uniref:Uncharacterized protein n=1 Tax=Potamilus streckersoni TaxID=2493646 RepID=A0AAE0WCY3_9BIVA|nr:hypothetical protein CHS0354_010463 [Potamilus streckersoni]